MTTKSRDKLRLCLLVTLALSVFACHLLADADPLDAIDSATVQLRTQRANLVTELDQARADLANLQTQLDTTAANLEAANSRIGLLEQRIAELEAGTPPPPPDTGASTISFAGATPISWIAGQAADVPLEADQPLAGDQTVQVLAFDVGPAPDYTWSNQRTLANLAAGDPLLVPASALNSLPAGKVALFLVPSWSDARATSLVTIEPVAKQVVTNLQVQAGKTYRNLIIKGGVSVVWRTIDDVTFENCDFTDAKTLLVVQARDDGSDASSGWTFRGCTFRGATRSDWGHSHGAFLAFVDDFSFEDCTFELNGWIGGKRFNQNHHVYMVNVGTVTYRRCKFIKASAQGLKCLGFKLLVVDGCEFRGNLIDIGGDDREPAGDMVVANTRFIDTGGTDSINLTYGWSINLEYSRNPLNQVTIRDCSWSGGVTSGPGFSGLRAIRAAGSGIGSVLVEYPNFDQWNGDKIINQIGGRLRLLEVQ